MFCKTMPGDNFEDSPPVFCRTTPGDNLDDWKPLPWTMIPGDTLDDWKPLPWTTTPGDTLELSKADCANAAFGIKEISTARRTKATDLMVLSLLPS